MRAATRNDLDHMRNAVFFEGDDLDQRLSRFWLLLVLASVIAAAGVVGDSTATVIGAMIVAPLMTPILGTMLAIVIGERGSFLRCAGLVLAGALAAVAIGYALGLLVPQDVVAPANSQVAGRIHPRLIDLVAALATGAVGSVALVRRDISDTLPGVAIAISLVPPLSVVGLTAEAGAYGQSAGALLLFVTNVTAILAVGVVVMALYGVHRMPTPPADDATLALNRRNAILAVSAITVLVVFTLATSTTNLARDRAAEAAVGRVAERWAEGVKWSVVEVKTDESDVVVRVEGPLPIPTTASLREALLAAGIDPGDVEVDLLPRERVEFEADE